MSAVQRPSDVLDQQKRPLRRDSTGLLVPAVPSDFRVHGRLAVVHDDVAALAVGPQVERDEVQPDRLLVRLAEQPAALRFIGDSVRIAGGGHGALADIQAAAARVRGVRHVEVQGACGGALKSLKRKWKKKCRKVLQIVEWNLKI